jgi:hypothetical protein
MARKPTDTVQINLRLKEAERIRLVAAARRSGRDGHRRRIHRRRAEARQDRGAVETCSMSIAPAAAGRGAHWASSAGT